MPNKPLSELGQLLANMYDKATGTWFTTRASEDHIKVGQDWTSPNTTLCKECKYSLVCLARHEIIEIFENRCIGVPPWCKCYAQYGFISFYNKVRCYLGFSYIECSVTDYNSYYSTSVNNAPEYIKKGLIALGENFSHLKLNNKKIESIMSIFEQHGRPSRYYRDCIWVRL